MKKFKHVLFVAQRLKRSDLRVVKRRIAVFDDIAQIGRRNFITDKGRYNLHGEVWVA